jgi:hypothetical protein
VTLRSHSAIASLALACLAAGCELVFPPGGDVPGDDVPGDDEPPTGCSAGQPFSNPRLVAIESSARVDSVRFNFDETRAFLSLCDSGADNSTCDLYSAVVTADQAILAPIALDGVNEAGSYDSYATTTDDRHLVFASDRAGPLSVFVAADNTGQWIASVELFELPIDDGQPHDDTPVMLGDERTMYFSSREEDSDFDLWRLEGSPPLFDATPIELDELDDGEDDLSPVVTEDEREIFYASGPSSDYDIYRATRGSPSAAWSDPVPLTELSSPFNDLPMWISPNGCRLYYVVEDSPTSSIYVVERGQ